MKSQKGLNQLTVPKSKRIDTIFSDILDNFGLALGDKITLGEMIKSIQKKGYVIGSILEKLIPSHINFEAIKKAQSTDFKKRFFDNLLFDSEEEKEAVKDIMEIIDNEFIITDIKIRIRDQANVIFIYGKSTNRFVEPFANSSELIFIRENK